MMNLYTPAETLPPPVPALEPPPFSWLPQMLRFLRRRWTSVAGSAGLALGLALLYLQLATPQYTAVTTLLLDIRHSNPFRQQPIVADSQYENSQVESQVEVLRSEGLARLIVERHGLVRDPEFNGFGQGMLGSALGFVTGLLGSGEPAAEPGAEELRSAAVARLMQLTTVRRVGLTAVIEVSVRTPDRILSARLANSIVEGYLQSQLAALSDVSGLASTWMQGRIAELRNEAIAADRAVQDYKARSNLLETDRGRFNEQQLGEYSTQLSQARARLAEARARVERVGALTLDRLAITPLPEALENSIIVGLRRQYLDARRREAEWSARYGAGHAAAVNARLEMAQAQQSIENELSRILETYRAEFEVAKANEAQVGQQLAALAAASAAADADRIMLRALQSSADSYRQIYENFLQRYTQAVQDQSFPIPEARVMTSAVPPLKPGTPKRALVLALGLVLGVFAGFAVALLRELLDRGLRTPAQVRAATGQPCLGLLPRLPQAGGAGEAADFTARRLATTPGVLRAVADTPDSAFAEAMRGVALRASWRRRAPGSLVIGCAAPRPGEGASTVAANLALAFAEAGHRTLLADLDLRRAGLSRALAPGRAGGAAEVAEGGAALEGLVWRDPATGLHFLPAAADAAAVHPARMLAPARIDRLLEALRAGYDRVVLDLPPFGATADAAALADLTDGLLVVAAWGGLDGESLAGMLNGLEIDHDKLLGIVLNRVNLRRLGHYGMPGHAALLPRRAAA